MRAHPLASAERASPFRRRESQAREIFSYIGEGDFGGKALGLGFIQNVLAEKLDPGEFPEIRVEIPELIVLRTSVFDDFMERNQLYDVALSTESDERIAHAFQRAEFPVQYLGDLRTIADQLRGPLAVRSSSQLEDAMFQPFAGVYATKMIPNNQIEPSARFQRILEAIKFVYASTFFREAKAYLRRTGTDATEEKMAVILQEVVGQRHGDRFYPTLSGVGRSFNWYPTGRAKPEQGVVDLALGLGKTIVDGGVVWSYSPAWPRIAPPTGSIRDLMNNSQNHFWAINLGDVDLYDPIKETEYMVRLNLSDAEEDGTLRYTASTYDGASDRLVPGIGRQGPRVLNFAPILQLNEVKLNPLIKKLLEISEEAVGEAVEIEFAVNLDPQKGTPARLGFVQVRPMVVFSEKVSVERELFDRPNLVAATESALGNGTWSDITDIVYVKPDLFEAKFTPRIAAEIEEINLKLTEESRPYLLIGFGRWGSSDPWLGIPVVWSQIGGAAVIVEATTPEMDVDLSQGSHFFHNLSAFDVAYFSVKHSSEHRIDWSWLASQPVINETEYVRHVRLLGSKPLEILVDGKTSRGVILHD